MPLSDSARSYLEARSPLSPRNQRAASLLSMSREGTGDAFKSGDYSLGLFHHDASEASIELLRWPELRDAAAGALLSLLDCADPSGRVHRAELPFKARELEPSKPVIAQYALRAMHAMGEGGPEWLLRHRVYPKVTAFLSFYEREYIGLHGLFLTHSALQSGFDNDLLSAQLPDKSVEGPDTNAFMVLEYRAAAELARALGNTSDADLYEERAATLVQRMEDLLWYEDERGGFYVALRWQHGVGALEAEIIGQRDLSGAMRPMESWTTLVPLYAGVPSPQRAQRLIARLISPDTYWGPSGVRTAPRHQPYFQQAARVMLFDFKKNGRGPVSNWTGPVWILSNYYLAMGLHRYGATSSARELSAKTLNLLADALAREGRLTECYDDAGRGLWPPAGTFVSWNVLALTLGREVLGLELG